MSNSGPIVLNPPAPPLYRQVASISPQGGVARAGEVLIDPYQPMRARGLGQRTPINFAWHGQDADNLHAALGSPQPAGPGSYYERRYKDNLAPPSYSAPLGMPNWTLNKVIGEGCDLSPKSPIPNPKRYCETSWRPEAGTSRYRFPSPSPFFNAVKAAIAAQRAAYYTHPSPGMRPPTRNPLTVLLPASSYGAQTSINGLSAPGQGLYG